MAYIDLDKAIERLNASPAFPNMGMDGYFLLGVVEDLLKRLPTIEFVRCKDCKHSYFVKSCSKYECRKGCGALKFADDFCSYGERKE